MLLFYVGNEQYALDCDYIIEIFPKVKLKKLSHLPDYVAGLMNYAGTPVPVIDVAQLIENHPSSSAMHTRIVLLNQSPREDETNMLALICEKVTATIDVEKSQFIDSGIKVKELPFLGGIYSHGEKSIQYFNVKELFKSLKGIVIE